MIKEEKPVTKLLIENAKQILTMQGESNHDVGMLEGGSIYIEGNLIKAIGPKADVDKYVEGIEDVQHINAQGKVICPGFIDCHTHVVFGGSRVAEYAIKLTDPRPETWPSSASPPASMPPST